MTDSFFYFFFNLRSTKKVIANRPIDVLASPDVFNGDILVAPDVFNGNVKDSYLSFPNNQIIK